MPDHRVRQAAAKQSRVFNTLANADFLMVRPASPVAQRTIFGLHGDDSDLAVSLKWLDAAGCQWEADFTEGSLIQARVTRNQIALKDTGGETVCVEVYDLKARRL